MIVAKKIRPRSRETSQSKKGKWEERRENQYFSKGEPLAVDGLIKIRDEDFVLVQWAKIGLAYVPYSFIKACYPRLLLDYYRQRSHFESY